jgi:hypothetical protein
MVVVVVLLIPKQQHHEAKGKYVYKRMCKKASSPDNGKFINIIYGGHKK